MSRRLQLFYFWMMVGPAGLGFLLFVAGPMFYSGYLSFTQYDVINPPRFIGWQNYYYLAIHDPSFWPSVKVTAIFAGVSVPLGLLLSLAFAMLLNARTRFLGFFRTAFFLPSILPGVASAVLWVWIFNPSHGLLNSFLRAAGVTEPPAWTSSPDWALSALIIIALWGFGGAMVIFLAGLQGVPRSLYEAAQLDGCGWWGQFRHVTLPMISPVLFFNLIMGIIGAMKVFDTAFVFGAAAGLVPGGPARATLFYVLNLYLKAFNHFHFGLASAMAWMLFLAIALLTAINFLLAKRWVHHE
jgi:multiple sugar transport system permease protein